MSTIKVTTLQNLSGVEVYTAKAWVNFNGTGTVAVRSSGNVSSITDLGTGYYQVDFTNALSSSDFSEQGTSGDSSGAHFTQLKNDRTTTSTRLFNKNLSGSLTDASELNLWAIE